MHNALLVPIIPPTFLHATTPHGKGSTPTTMTSFIHNLLP
jgi:hypothetical protein